MPIKELPDDLRDDPALKDFNDLPSLAKSFKETKAFVGSSIRPPGEAATAEQKAEFYEKLKKHAPNLVPLDVADEKAAEIVWEKLGRPKDAKEYDYKPPPEVGAVDLEPLRESAKALGLTKAQFTKMAAKAVEGRTKQLAELQADQAALKTEWGAAYQEKLGKAATAAEKLKAPAEVVAAIKAGTLRSGQLKLWDDIAKAIGTEPPANGGGGPPGPTTPGALTPAEAEIEISALQKGGALYNKGHADHEKAKARYLKLMEYVLPQSA